ncbi:MAG: hypothetical protein EOP51_07225 [Sphingobacteriales bacterium]|nr:MAG: hypothetical protein EOP51_07225 [Sphingobacteriales bacterium]
MKKFLVIPIMFVYLLAVSGIMVTAHYCGQEMESLSFFSKSDQCDESECNDEPGKSDGCCEDKTVAVKIANEQDAVTAFKLKLQQFEIAVATQLPVYYNASYVAFSKAAPAANRANAPPGLWQSIPLYKLHSNFIYYG